MVLFILVRFLAISKNDLPNFFHQTNKPTPKTIKKSVTDLVTDLVKEEYSLSVRAANTISLLDDVTQDPNMPSYVRTQLWQAVSKLESIRE